MGQRGTLQLLGLSQPATIRADKRLPGAFEATCLGLCKEKKLMSRAISIRADRRFSLTNQPTDLETTFGKWQV